MADELESDIHTTAEDIAADSEVLQAIELEKASLDVKDPRVLELSHAAKDLVREIASKTAAQHELVLEANGVGGSNGAAKPAG